jgi:hypothetical protein
LSAAFYDEAGRMRTLKLGGTSGSPVLARSYSYNGWSTATDGGMLNTLVSTNQQSVTLLMGSPVFTFQHLCQAHT